MKSKRLKNFCEVCRKQCKDQNGYHCHLNSGFHQKKLRELATNPQEHIQKYSNELEHKIVQILKSKYPGEPKDLEDIYEQYAEEKFHVKFNFTRWRDLAEFAQHLRTNVRNLRVEGKLPYCKVTYVVNKAGDFMKQKREELILQKKEKQKEMQGKKLEQRIVRMRQAETQRYNQMKQKYQKQQQEEEQFDLDNQQFRFDFAEKTYQPSKIFLQPEEDMKKVILTQEQPKHKNKNMEKLLDELQNKKTKNKDQTAKDQQEQFEWILPGIIVKVLPHDIPEVFHGKKASISSIKEPYVAEINLGNATLDIDQANLETVIPKIEHEVKILRGEHRNKNGTLKQVNIEQGIGTILVDGLTIQVPFNQFSKSA